VSSLSDDALYHLIPLTDTMRYQLLDVSVKLDAGTDLDEEDLRLLRAVIDWNSCSPDVGGSGSIGYEELRAALEQPLREWEDRQP
jgi:hypothetical protein